MDFNKTIREGSKDYKRLQWDSKVSTEAKKVMMFENQQKDNQNPKMNESVEKTKPSFTKYSSGCKG